MKIVKRLIDEGAKINQQIKLKKLSPLHASVYGGHVDIVKFLIHKKADMYILGTLGTPLYAAAEQSNLQLAKLLLQNEANVDRVGKTCESPLHKSVEKQYISMIELLLKYNADVSILHHGKYTLLFTAITHKWSEGLKFLLSRKHGNNDVNVPCNEQTLLALAADMDYAEAIKLLLSYGANVNLLPNQENVQENKEKQEVKKEQQATKTALMYASEKCHRRAVERLLEEGADINLTNEDKSSALHYALFNSDIDGVKRIKTCDVLLRYKASPKIKNKFGVSPFYYAIRRKTLPITEAFLRSGARANDEEEHGENSLHYLITRGMKCFELLVTY